MKMSVQNLVKSVQSALFMIASMQLEKSLIYPVEPAFNPLVSPDNLDCLVCAVSFRPHIAFQGAPSLESVCSRKIGPILSTSMFDGSTWEDLDIIVRVLKSHSRQRLFS